MVMVVRLWFFVLGSISIVIVMIEYVMVVLMLMVVLSDIDVFILFISIGNVVDIMWLKL